MLSSGEVSAGRTPAAAAPATPAAAMPSDSASKSGILLVLLIYALISLLYARPTTVVFINLMLMAALACASIATALSASTPAGRAVNAQLYNCGRSRAQQQQIWAWGLVNGSGEIRQPHRGVSLQLQSLRNNPSLATTCPGGNHSTSPCYNLVIGTGPGLAFKPASTGPPGAERLQLVVDVTAGGAAAAELKQMVASAWPPPRCTAG